MEIRELRAFLHPHKLRLYLKPHLNHSLSTLLIKDHLGLFLREKLVFRESSTDAFYKNIQSPHLFFCTLLFKWKKSVDNYLWVKHTVNKEYYN